MPRTLPWLTEAQKWSNPTTSSSSSAPRRKRSPFPSSDLDDLDLNPVGVSTPARRSKLIRPARSPSTSPPPALPAPPEVEYMHPGFTADDSWMMVEDEFLATAQLYTRHLHHAAYAEAKRRARAQGQRTLRNLGREVDGVTEQGVGSRMGWEKEGLERRRREEAADELGDGEEDGEDGVEWEVDPQLAGLMNRVERKGASTALQGLGLRKIRSETRAAKGFLRSPEKASAAKLRDGDPPYSEVEEEASDDLDGPAPRRQTAGSSKPPTSKAHVLTKEQQRQADKRKSTSIFKKFAAARDEPDSKATSLKRKDMSTSPKKRENHTSKRIKLDSLIRLPSSPPRDRSTRPKKSDKDIETEEFLARRAARRQKRAEEEKKAAESKKRVFDDLPTFMI